MYEKSRGPLGFLVGVFALLGGTPQETQAVHEQSKEGNAASAARLGTTAGGVASRAAGEERPQANACERRSEAPQTFARVDDRGIDISVLPPDILENIFFFVPEGVPHTRNLPADLRQDPKTRLVRSETFIKQYWRLTNVCKHWRAIMQDNKLPWVILCERPHCISDLPTLLPRRVHPKTFLGKYHTLPCIHLTLTQQGVDNAAETRRMADALEGLSPAIKHSITRLSLVSRQGAFWVPADRELLLACLSENPFLVVEHLYKTFPVAPVIEEDASSLHGNDVLHLHAQHTGGIPNHRVQVSFINIPQGAWPSPTWPPHDCLLSDYRPACFYQAWSNFQDIPKERWQELKQLSPRTLRRRPDLSPVEYLLWGPFCCPDTPWPQLLGNVHRQLASTALPTMPALEGCLYCHTQEGWGQLVAAPRQSKDAVAKLVVTPTSINPRPLKIHSDDLAPFQGELTLGAVTYASPQIRGLGCHTLELDHANGIESISDCPLLGRFLCMAVPDLVSITNLHSLSYLNLGNNALITTLDGARDGLPCLEKLHLERCAVHSVANFPLLQHLRICNPQGPLTPVTEPRSRHALAKASFTTTLMFQAHDCPQFSFLNTMYSILVTGPQLPPRINLAAGIEEAFQLSITTCPNLEHIHTGGRNTFPARWPADGAVDVEAVDVEVVDGEAGPAL